MDRLDQPFRQEIAHRFAIAEGLSLVDGIRRLASESNGPARLLDSAWWESVSEPPQPVPVVDASGREWPARAIVATALDDRGRLWEAGLPGVACRLDDGRWRTYEGKDGLPYNKFTCAAGGPYGEVWFGTDKGLIRFQNGEWAYRQGLRWLPSDDVREILVDPNGHVWCLTAEGIGLIERRLMTLRQKAEHYEHEVASKIKRTSYGYLSPVRAAHPGDKSDISRSDNDNDGLWTSMYGAGQCFAYAATGEESYRQRAHAAFRALRFLQQVPQLGKPRPPKGYVARTIRSTELPDPNAGRQAHDEQFRRDRDRLWKVYEPRWPKTDDGDWYWKSDTSSDELDGHYFFYGLYNDLVAQSDVEREAVREVVGALTDHLIEHGFTLTDHDGTPTRWGYFNPEALNHDPNWHVERGLNSLSLLAYLAIAEHVTGDARYAEVAKGLRDEHGYHTNLMVPKVHLGAGSGNQSDDEMAFMTFYHLVRYTNDPALKARYTKAFHSYWQLESAERNPFFNMAYAAVAGDTVFDTPWGAAGLQPTGDWLEDSLATLHGFPLDRFDWPHQNSHRLDIVLLSKIQSRGLDEPDTTARGHRVDGKVLPVEERHFNHWNTDPWQLDYGGDGRTLACGTVFLLPYYMMLYHLGDKEI